MSEKTSPTAEEEQNKPVSGGKKKPKGASLKWSYSKLKQEYEKLEKKYHNKSDETRKLRARVHKLKEQNEELKEDLKALEGVVLIQKNLYEFDEEDDFTRGDKNDPTAGSQSESSTLIEPTKSDSATNTGSSKKSSSDKPDKEKQKKTAFDPNWIVDIRMGLRFVLDKKFITDVELEKKDYSYSYQTIQERTVGPKGDILKFKDFAPRVFHKIRKLSEITEQDVLHSFRADNVFAVKGEGKSGAFMIISKDSRFVLKTATGDERDFLWSFLPIYYQYLRKNPNTLLPRIYGLYSMKHSGVGGVIRFFIMNNVFNSDVYHDPIEKYDLKGSTYGRYVPEHKKAKVSTWKDLDIVENKRKVYIPKELWASLQQQLKLDSQFLADNRLMDYSLLVGVHYVTEENKAVIKARVDKANRKDVPRGEKNAIFKDSLFTLCDGCIRTWNKDEERYEYVKLGIIDILGRYGKRKQLEHFLRSIGGNGEDISVVEPSYYADRFYTFMTETVMDEVDVPLTMPAKKRKKSKNDVTLVDTEDGSSKKKSTKKEGKEEASSDLEPPKSARDAKSTKSQRRKSKRKVRKEVATKDTADSNQ